MNNTAPALDTKTERVFVGIVLRMLLNGHQVDIEVVPGFATVGDITPEKMKNDYGGQLLIVREATTGRALLMEKMEKLPEGTIIQKTMACAHVAVMTAENLIFVTDDTIAKS